MTAASGRRRECDDVKREVSTNEVQGEPASADWRRVSDGVVLRGETEQRSPAGFKIQSNIHVHADHHNIPNGRLTLPRCNNTPNASPAHLHRTPNRDAP